MITTPLMVLPLFSGPSKINAYQLKQGDSIKCIQRFYQGSTEYVADKIYVFNLKNNREYHFRGANGQGIYTFSKDEIERNFKRL